MKGFPRKQKYEVPIIANDLRHEELIHQIADSLDHLQTTMNDVFSKIGQRLSDNRTRLSSINDRTRLAQAKIDHLSTTARKKATQVFSSSKFPAQDHPQAYRSILNSEDAPTMKTSKFKLKNRHHSPPSDRDVKEKLNFHPMSYEKIEEKTQFDNLPQGLGSLPTNIDSVSSLLLFNTDENPYKNYVLIDPRGVVTRIRVQEEEQYTGPQDAPQTIGQREEMDQANKQSMNYNPDLGNVPEFSVPTDLPDLPDIAGDIQFASEGFAAIAPSAFGQIPDLPEFQITTSSSTAPPPPDAGSAPPPPPPGVDSRAAAQPPPPPPPAADAPPPPPPPAAEAPPSGPVAAPESQAPPSKPVIVPEEGDDHNGLMDAIRKSGGIGKLKKAAKKVIAEKRKEKPPPTSGGGDMMSDLMGRLASRRKAMAGGGTAAKTGEAEVPKPPTVEIPTGDPMSKISDMIAYNPPNKADDNDAEWD